MGEDAGAKEGKSSSRRHGWRRTADSGASLDGTSTGEASSSSSSSSSNSLLETEAKALQTPWPQLSVHLPGRSGSSETLSDNGAPSAEVL